MIRFTCPTCGLLMQMPDEHAGQKTNCPKCNQRLQIPIPPAPPPVVNKTVLAPLAPAEPPPLPHDSGAVTAALRPVRDDDSDDDDLPPRRRRTRRRSDDDDLMPHRGTAIMVMGIIGLFVLPIVFGPIAWMWASEDLKKMDQGIMDPDGRGSTQAGMIFGIIGTVVSLLALGLLALYFLFCCGLGGLFIRPQRPF